MAVKYTDQIFGGSAALSVATFGNLPAIGVTSQRISITGESSLFDTTSYPAIVTWSGSAWQLESCAATYLKIGAVEFASGTWTGTGGTVGTKSEARIVDTTYKESWIWNSTSNIFVPAYLNVSTVGFQKKIKGDSATLESGWEIDTQTNSTLMTDGGGKLTFTSTSTSSPTSVSNNKIFYTDTAGSGATNNFYMKCLLQRTSCVVASTGGASIYIRHDTGSGGKAVEFGDGTTINTGIGLTGKFMNRAVTVDVTYSATANRGDTAWFEETLVQFRVIVGIAAQVKIGTGGWHDISVASCRAGSNTLRFEMGTVSSNGSANIASMKVRYLQAIRYT